MAKLLRLHLTCVGHKDARFFPLKLDFRNREGAATDNVIWLLNGGGKSSLLNLFFSTLLPESRKFLGSRAETRDRRLGDYVKATDLACIVTEWEMPAAENLFSTTRIVGQVLAWKGGVVSSGDEERLDREFFTFRGSDKVPFDSLPIYGLGNEPKLNMQALREWLSQLAVEHRELEVERGNEGKAKWRQRLDAAGIDTELFNYQLTMNMREGGAAELFKVRDTMEFVDLFLEMALHPQQAEKTADQIESVQEKLRKLPARLLEERFLLELLSHLHPLTEEARAWRDASAAATAQRRANHLLRSAIEHSISALRTRLATLDGDLVAAEKAVSDTRDKKLQAQEYRLNYDHLARRLAHREAKTAHEVALRELQTAKTHERIAEAAISHAGIISQQIEFDSLLDLQRAALAEQKPVLDELHGHGATYASALDRELEEIASLLSDANGLLATREAARTSADEALKVALAAQAAAGSELEAIHKRLVARDIRRADLRDDGIVLPKEKAVDALRRHEEEESQVETANAGTRERKETVAGELRKIAEEKSSLDVRRARCEARAQSKDAEHTRGTTLAGQLRARTPIIEVTGSEAADIDSPELPALLTTRAERLGEGIIQARLDGAEDRRALHSIETERLLPPLREVEIVIAHLRDLGIASALPAYRFVATNTPDSMAATEALARDPARLAGVMITREAEFDKIKGTNLTIPSLRHPVVITLSALPDSDAAPRDPTVALPGSAGAYHFATAAADQPALESRIGRVGERIQELEQSRAETYDAATQLAEYRRDFGSHRLTILAGERDEHRAEVTCIDGRLAELEIGRAALATEQSDLDRALQTGERRLRELGKIQQRLASYIEEHERYEQALMAERDARQTRLGEIEREITTHNETISQLDEEIASARDAASSHKLDQRTREQELATIAYRTATGDDTISLEASRTIYRNALARFEERFGQSRLDGQIEEKQKNLAGLRSEHEQQFGELDRARVEETSRLPNLRGLRESARQAHFTANSALEQAKTRLNETERNLPAPKAHKQGEGLPPGVPVPETSAEAEACRETLAGEIAELESQLSAANENLVELKADKTGVESSITARGLTLDTLDGLTEAGSGPMPSLPATDAELGTLVKEAKAATTNLDATQKQADKAAEDRISRLLDITHRAEFSSLPATARERFVALRKDEFLDRCEEFARGYESRRAILRNEIEELDRDKDIVVRQLDGVGTAALRLLGQAERASVMPDTFPGWAGLPFLRIGSQPVTEPAARRDRLAALVERLVQERAIPRGAALASAAVREIGGHIKATLLKPEDPLRPDRHDITEFGTFSGGEKMTAAILLYVTLAQLRSRARHDSARARAAGVLILDNPLGTASKREFVELQLRVARQMGVQLIFTTGVNDLGALEVLPRILRLRKRHRDGRSGDLLLSQDPAEEHIEGVHANLRSP